MLQPTSPLRKIKDVRECTKLIINKKYDAVWSVSETNSKFHPDKQLKIVNKKLKYLTKNGKAIVARQQLSKVYHRNGNVYAIKSSYLLNNTRIMSKNTGAYIINTKQISIDTAKDLASAEKYFIN